MSRIRLRKHALITDPPPPPAAPVPRHDACRYWSRADATYGVCSKSVATYRTTGGPVCACISFEKKTCGKCRFWQEGAGWCARNGNGTAVDHGSTCYDYRPDYTKI